MPSRFLAVGDTVASTFHGGAGLVNCKERAGFGSFRHYDGRSDCHQGSQPLPSKGESEARCTSCEQDAIMMASDIGKRSN